ncbi:MAG: transcriptional regulator, partial [Pseudomonadota bacterium]
MYAPDSDYAFDKDLSERLRHFRGPPKKGLRKWAPGQLFMLVVAITVLVYLLVTTSNRFFQPDVQHVTLVLGSLGAWRFSWWFTHAVRAEIYRRVKFPKMRERASAVWNSGWRPRRLHIQMTTYYEEPAITKRVIGSILAQIRRERIPTTLYIGTGSSYDELIIRSFVETHAQDIPDDLAELVFIRQNQPGKRMA